MAAEGLRSRIRWGEDDRPTITIEDGRGVVHFCAVPDGDALICSYRLRESFNGGREVGERLVESRFTSPSAVRRLTALLIRWHDEQAHELLPLVQPGQAQPPEEHGLPTVDASAFHPLESGK